jgi:plastocyanin domain-containing protein
MLVINLGGVALIALIVWWFWLYKPGEDALNDANSLIVVESGIYQPAHIRLAANQPAELHFMRKDASPCSEIVQIPDLEISENLPLNKHKSIVLPPLKAGDYEFHCQMQMYRGVIHVE